MRQTNLWRKREEAAIIAIEELIDGGFTQDDHRSEGGWAERDAEGHVIVVNLEGTNNVHVTDEWLTHFSAFTMLEGIQLDYNPTFTGSGFQYLKNLHHLKAIAVWSTQVNDKSLLHLKAHEQIQNLRLSETDISDDGIISLANLCGLRGLELYGIYDDITDRCVPTLCEFSNLEYLDVSGTDLTMQGVMDLISALPKCRISHSTEAGR